MTATHRTVKIPAGGVILTGDLQMPQPACGIVLFAHGSGSSRLSSRNRYVADQLNLRGLGTLLFDLLSQEEEKIDEVTRELRFDIGLLTDRVDAATDWLRSEADLTGLGVGYFGASTGAAAALAASVRHKTSVKAVVSRGGRPDLAGGALSSVTAPTLLIVGSLDWEVIELNRKAMAQMSGEVELKIVEGASHLFEEPGKLEVVSQLASDWFTAHFPGLC